MREPYRLYNFHEKLREIHIEKCPDLRFGQLCFNFFGWLAAERGVAYVFLEENELLTALERYAEKH